MKYTDKIDIFAGCFATKAGKIIQLDGDTFYDEEYEEWTNTEEGIQNGLTVVVPYN